MKPIIYGVIGGLLGETISKVLLSGSVWSLIPWGIIGLGLGYLSTTKKEALISGAVYGFVVCLIFMWLGYAGVAPIATRIPFFAVIGLFGALCAAASSFVGYTLKTRFKS